MMLGLMITAKESIIQQRRKAKEESERIKSFLYLKKQKTALKRFFCFFRYF
jgi:hypothetical protein